MWLPFRGANLNCVGIHCIENPYSKALSILEEKKEYKTSTCESGRSSLSP